MQRSAIRGFVTCRELESRHGVWERLWCSHCIHWCYCVVQWMGLCRKTYWLVMSSMTCLPRIAPSGTYGITLNKFSRRRNRKVSWNHGIRDIGRLLQISTFQLCGSCNRRARSIHLINVVSQQFSYASSTVWYIFLLHYVPIKPRQTILCSARFNAYNVCHRMITLLDNARQVKNVKQTKARSVETLSIKHTACYRAMWAAWPHAPIAHTHPQSWHETRNLETDKTHTDTLISEHLSDHHLQSYMRLLGASDERTIVA